jgi:hypothetical protein
MRCSYGSLNAGAQLHTPSKVHERLPCFALPDIALFWAREPRVRARLTAGDPPAAWGWHE